MIDAEDKLHVNFSNFSSMNVLSEYGRDKKKKEYSNAMEWMIWTQASSMQNKTKTCEALYKTDCDSNPNACLPRPTECTSTMLRPFFYQN
jgi:hypothetical protein